MFLQRSYTMVLQSTMRCGHPCGMTQANIEVHRHLQHMRMELGVTYTKLQVQE